MRRKKLATIAVATAMAAVGTGAAVGAVAGDDAKQTEQEILDRAAQQLEVTPDALRDALGDALDAQLDEAVAAGRLTREQADSIKERRQDSGRVLGIGPGGPHHRMRHAGGPHPILGDAADALGITERRLFRSLRAGKTLAEIAKAQGKDLAGVKAAVKSAAEKRLAAAVDDGDLTQAQADERLEHLDEHLDRLAEDGLPAMPRGGHRSRHLPHPGFGG